MTVDSKILTHKSAPNYGTFTTRGPLQPLSEEMVDKIEGDLKKLGILLSSQNQIVSEALQKAKVIGPTGKERIEENIQNANTLIKAYSETLQMCSPVKSLSTLLLQTQAQVREIWEKLLKLPLPKQ